MQGKLIGRKWDILADALARAGGTPSWMGMLQQDTLFLRILSVCFWGRRGLRNVTDQSHFCLCSASCVVQQLKGTGVTQGREKRLAKCLLCTTLPATCLVYVALFISHSNFMSEDHCLTRKNKGTRNWKFCSRLYSSVRGRNKDLNLGLSGSKLQLVFGVSCTS